MRRLPITFLDEELLFPPPERARRDGLLAVGGDLSVERLVVRFDGEEGPMRAVDGVSFEVGRGRILR